MNAPIKKQAPKPTRTGKDQCWKKTPERLKSLLDDISGGKSINYACFLNDITRPTFYNWLDQDPLFKQDVDIALAQRDAEYEAKRASIMPIAVRHFHELLTNAEIDYTVKIGDLMKICGYGQKPGAQTLNVFNATSIDAQRAETKKSTRIKFSSTKDSNLDTREAITENEYKESLKSLPDYSEYYSEPQVIDGEFKETAE